MKSKNILALLLALLSCQLYAQMRGDGSVEHPFQIETLEDFLQFRDTVNNGFPTACADLQTDIDLSSVCYEDTLTETCIHWFPIGEGNLGTRYEGRFDGKGHVVRNLFVKSDVENFRGLFGATHKATLLNIGVEDAYLHGGYYVGGIVGNGDSTFIANCYARGDIFGYFVSGIIGNAKECTLKNCYSTCITKGNYRSNIVGYATNSSLENCIFDPSTTKIGVGNGAGSAISMKTEQFLDGTVCQRLNDYVKQYGGDSLLLWKQNSDNYPTFDKEASRTSNISQNNGVQLFVNHHHIYASTERETELFIFNVWGLGRKIFVSQGVNDLGEFSSGLYIINGQKVIVCE